MTEASLARCALLGRSQIAPQAQDLLRDHDRWRSDAPIIRWYPGSNARAWGA
jgi:hypothetical protein